jgi:general secretion pathway protein C
MRHASAIISRGKSGNEDIYGVGDRIQSGVTVKQIYPDYVMLDRNGASEILKLQKISGLAGVESAIKAAARAKEAAKSELADLRKILVYEPTRLDEYILPVVVNENGKQLGYRLQPLKNQTLLTRLGLQSYDVIMEVNGFKLDSPRKGIQVLRFLKSATQFNLVVKRNGEDVPVQISLK